jgi:predicted RNA-binding Zn ribbon-like protein
VTNTSDGAIEGSTTRLQLAPAPTGLRLVQDLVNTVGYATFDIPDLLADHGSATAWLKGALEGWSERTGIRPASIRLRASELEPLRRSRDRLRHWLATDGPEFPARTVKLTITETAYLPEGDGADALLDLVYAELVIARHTGTLKRLKTCANPGCGAAFYDGSVNASRRWHDVKTCGNAANLRASRNRRRTAPRAPLGGTD